MPTVLKNVLRYTGLAVGVPVALPHQINVNDVPKTPQIVIPKLGGFVVTADAVNVTVTRSVVGGPDLDVYVEFWHTIEAVVPLPGLGGLVPFILEPGSGGGGSTGVDVQDEGIPLPGNPHQTLNFEGAGVVATDMGGGVAKITIPGGGGAPGINVQDEGVVLPGSPYTTVNFTGGGVTATDMAGVATVDVPGVTVSDEGGPAAQVQQIDFVGAGVNAVVLGGLATVTIPGTQLAIQDEGVPQGNASTLDVVGGGASIVVAGSTATLTVPTPAIAIQDHSVPQGLATTLNVLGGATISLAGSTAELTVPYVIESLPERWAQNPVVANQTDVALSCLVSIAFDDIKSIRAGSIVGINWRLSNAVTAGTLTVTATVAGAAGALSGSSTNALNQTGGSAIQVAGIDIYGVNVAIGVFVTTTADFAAGVLPVLEVWLEVTPG